MSGRLLTTRDVAELLGLSTETVLRYARRGELPAIRLPGTARGRLRFREAELEAWLDGHATATPGREAPSPHSGAAEARVSFPVPSPSPQSTAASTEEESRATR